MSGDERAPHGSRRRSRIAPPGSAANASISRDVDGAGPDASAGEGRQASRSQAKRGGQPRNPHYRGSDTTSSTSAARLARSSASTASPATPSAPSQTAGSSSRVGAGDAITVRDPEVVWICTRNDADIVVERAEQWRARLPSLRSRVAVLDLGSTDATVAVARAANIDVHVIDGGRAEPLPTLDEAIGTAEEPIVLFADAALEPPTAISVLIDAVHAGAAARLHQQARGAVFVCRRSAWRGQPFSAHAGLLDWAGQAGDAPLVGAPQPVIDDDFDVGVVRAAVALPRAREPLDHVRPLLRVLREAARSRLNQTRR